MEVIREVELLLNRLHADDSNDDYDEATTSSRRANAGKRPAVGACASKEYILQHELHVPLPGRPLKPCLFVRFSVPEGDAFITGRWHYGSERLGTALKNFFGEQFEHY